MHIIVLQNLLETILKHEKLHVLNKFCAFISHELWKNSITVYYITLGRQDRRRNFMSLSKKTIR